MPEGEGRGGCFQTDSLIVKIGKQRADIYCPSKDNVYQHQERGKPQIKNTYEMN